MSEGGCVYIGDNPTWAVLYVAFIYVVFCILPGLSATRACLLGVVVMGDYSIACCQGQHFNLTYWIPLQYYAIVSKIIAKKA